MIIFDELGVLENHFIEEQKKGRKMSDLYESVQHAGNIIPRLYLLITVGSAYVKTGEAPVKLILRDLLDMVKGVQQPIRGLFLRYYLLKMMKDKLPDKDSPYEGEGGDVNDAIEFILQNLSEMNRLWVRMQHLASVTKDKEHREIERSELRVTVGENIIRLGHLEGLTYDNYRAIVLPKILDIIVICKDPMAQQYLMDCIIQVFPDEYHLQSLEALLDTTSNLNHNVDIKNIFINLMDKLSKFASAPAPKADGSQAPTRESQEIFKLFKKYTDKIIEEQGKTIQVFKLLELEVAFMNFSIKTYPKNIGYVNQILESCVSILRSTPISNQDEVSMKLLVKLLSIPLESLFIAVLDMNHYPTLMKYMKFANRRTVSLRIVKAVINDKNALSSPKTVEQLIDFVMPLLQDDKDSGQEEPYEFEEGQEAVAKLVHLVKHPKSLDLWFEILMKFKRVFVKGGVKRMKYTCPALIFALFRLSIEIINRPDDGFDHSQEEVKTDEDEIPLKLTKVD
jgi:vacuolar protein sorting-associated protein 35